MMVELDRQLFNIELGVDELKKLGRKHSLKQEKAKSRARGRIESGEIESARRHAGRAVVLGSKARHCLDLSTRLRRLSIKVREIRSTGGINPKLAEMMTGMDEAVRSYDVPSVGHMVDVLEEELMPPAAIADVSTESVRQDSVKALLQDLIDDVNNNTSCTSNN